MNADDYMVKDVQIANVNGIDKKLFKAYERRDKNAFVFVGQFIAPAKTATSDLWQFVEASEQRRIAAECAANGHEHSGEYRHAGTVDIEICARCGVNIPGTASTRIG